MMYGLSGVSVGTGDRILEGKTDGDDIMGDIKYKSFMQHVCKEWRKQSGILAPAAKSSLSSARCAGPIPERGGWRPHMSVAKNNGNDNK